MTSFLSVGNINVHGNSSSRRRGVSLKSTNVSNGSGRKSLQLLGFIASEPVENFKAKVMQPTVVEDEISESGPTGSHASSQD